MTQDEASEIRTRILNRSLDEIRSSTDSELDKNKPGPAQNSGAADAQDAEACVICLEPISEPARARPCGHKNFDLLCLLNWLEQRTRCPLCNGEIRTVEYQDVKGADHSRPQVIDVVKELKKHDSSGTPSINSPHQSVRASLPHRNRRRHPRPERSRRYEQPDTALLRRRDVYRHRLYSLHVGSNRISAYRDLTPADFTNSSAHVARARTWIRRELEAFSFLDSVGNTEETRLPTTSISAAAVPRTMSSSSSSSSSSLPPPGPAPRQPAKNAHFLLEYIIAILKTVDVRDSSGHAETLVSEFLGRDNARLFLHELNSWLRSPYESLEAWDRHVQYPRVPTELERNRDRREFNGRKRRRDDSPDERSVLERGRGGRGGRGARRYLDRYVPD